MACREISQIFRDAGTDTLMTDGNHASVIAGQVVKKVQANADAAAYITPALAEDNAATAYPYAFAMETNVAPKANDLYIPFNFKSNKNLISCNLTKGALLELWNDGTGAVFTDNAANAAAGTLLYVDANGILTEEAGNAGTVGAVAVAEVVKPAADANGVLTIRTLI